jgi:hypothetical protein
MENTTEATPRRRGRPLSNKPLKTPTSFRLSAEGHAILLALADDMGLSNASVIETVLRDAAKLRGITASTRD